VADEPQRLRDWEKALQGEVERWQAERSRVESELQRATKKLELVREMRSLDASPASTASLVPSAIKDGRATPTSVREMTQRILSESARPLHINEIHQQFVERGYPIPGSGTPFNILAHLVNDNSFVRVARGTYALTGSVPEDQVMPKAPRKPRRRRKRKKTAARQPMEGK